MLVRVFFNACVCCDDGERWQAHIIPSHEGEATMLQIGIKFVAWWRHSFRDGNFTPGVDTMCSLILASRNRYNLRFFM